MEEIAKIFATIISLIIVLYIAYIIITSFIEITPGFAIFGWGIFIVILIFTILGIIAFFRDLF